MKALLDRIKAQSPIERDDYKQLLIASIQAESFQFARLLAQKWLEKYPGDLEIEYILARIHANDDKLQEARKLLEWIVKIDPEFIEAQELLARTNVSEEGHPSLDTMACVYVMGRTIYSDFTIPDWSFVFRAAWQAFLAKQFIDAEQLIRQVIVQKPDLALASIVHHRIVHAKGDEIGAGQLVKIYHERYPECLYFTHLLADRMMREGNELEGMDLLRECVVRDAFGTVPARLWGKTHRYLNLWPKRYEVKLDTSLPVEVLSYLGMNNLPEGELRAPVEELEFAPPELITDDDETPINHFFNVNQDPTGTPDSDEKNTIQVVDEIFEKLAKKLKQPELSRSDGRFPVYVILSLKSRLIQKYGRQTFLVLDTELQNLASGIRKKRGWGAIVVYPDEPANLVGFGLSKIDQIDPWKVKNVLVDLDRALGKKGEMIGALLIVGGDEIVPYHRLPNPTDDFDPDVPSDNPYGAMDGNYFVQEWPVGRLPDEPGNDAGFLLAQIRTTGKSYLSKIKESTFFERLLAYLKSLGFLSNRKRISGNLGYTAAIWQRASRSVFRSIGNGQRLFTSPPEYSGTIQSRKLTESKMAYYNLHGLEDSAEWYGQKELGDTLETDYPVALSPMDIIKNGSSPEIVFSEACYGGHVVGKSEETSIALRYLGIGAGAFIGSTCVSYGSIDTPLIGADLLAQLFWRNMHASLSAGEAFARAKLDFLKEMEKRQGFLDGEDQKTLLSFVFLGDPLFCPSSTDFSSKRIIRRITAPKVALLSENDEALTYHREIPAETIQEVKKMAQIYLPGLEEVQLNVTQQKMILENGAKQKARKAGDHPTNTPGKDEHTVITVSKSVPMNKRMHHHYIRARIDTEGHFVKVAISR